MRVDPEVLRFLESQETLCVGWADDLKVETTVDDDLPVRIWVSRIGAPDGAARNNDVSIEVWNVREGKWIEYSSLSNSIVRAWFTEALRSAGYSGGGL
jgi:hypothetical protein